MLQSIINQPHARGTFFELFSIDIRSLALLRVGVAICSLFYVGESFQEADVFLSDQGVLPVGLSRELLNTGPNWYWSFYWFRDSLAFSHLLLGFHLLAGLMLLVGLGTRYATIACLLLTWSLEVRNPLLVGNGIHLLRMLLVWSAFLPLGRVWSIDAMRNNSSDRKKTVWHIANAATCALMLQVLLYVALFGISVGLGRFSVADWFQFEFNLSAFGNELSSQTTLMKGIQWFVFVASCAAPVTMFLPYVNDFFRGFWLAVFWLVQISMILLFSGTFYPIVAIVSWFVFIPSHFWNDWFGEPLSFEYWRSDRPGTSRKIQRWSQTGCAVLLAMTILVNLIQWQIVSLGSSGNASLLRVSQLLLIAPRWHFVPTYCKRETADLTRPWFVYEGRASYGRNVDLLDYQNVNVGEKPKSVAAAFPTERWRRFHLRVWETLTESETRKKIAEGLLKRMVKKWNAVSPGGAGELTQAKLVCFQEQLVDGHIVSVQDDVWASTDNGSVNPFDR